MQSINRKKGTVAAAWGLMTILAGCRSADDAAESTMPAGNPTAQATTANTSDATGGPTPAASATPTAYIGGKYRVRVDADNRTNVTFTVLVNDQQIGSFNADAENDITAQVRPGKNDLQVRWTNDRNMPSYAKSSLFVERQAGDSVTWNTVFSREVRKDTSETEAKSAFTAGSGIIADGSIAENAAPDATPGGMSTPDASPSPEAVASSGSVKPAESPLKDRYVVKVKPTALAPADFTVTLNGEQIGSYNTQANQDITDMVKAGKNVVVIGYKATKPITNMFAETTLTVGMERDGKWSTVANQSVRKSDSNGEKTFRFVAR